MPDFKKIMITDIVGLVSKLSPERAAEVFTDNNWLELCALARDGRFAVAEEMLETTFFASDEDGLERFYRYLFRNFDPS